MIRQLKTWSALLIGVLFLAAAQAATVETRQIPSEAMHKAYPAIVAIPDGYAQSKTAYPVVYLLHGYSGNYEGWARLANLGDFADRYGVIIVSPDGAFDSWYFDIPADPACQFETYISKEVVGYIDQNFRTVAAPKGRAIAGLSMGGHGAMYLSMRHKDVFGAAGSMSGGLDIRPFPKNWNIAKHIGTEEENPAEWDKRTAINNIGDLKNGELALTFDCGVDDFFIKVNRAFHEELLKRGIAHDYTERPGAHTGVYWSNSIKYQMLFFHDFFVKGAQAAATPAPAK
jgi:S-formylglutathione hydrolase FrmB